MILSSNWNSLPESKSIKFGQERKYPMAATNTNKRWSKEEISRLRELARGNTPTRIIGMKLKRTPEAVSSKASDLHVSLKPVNQKPYNRSKK